MQRLKTSCTKYAWRIWAILIGDLVALRSVNLSGDPGTIGRTAFGWRAISSPVHATMVWYTVHLATSITVRDSEKGRREDYSTPKLPRLRLRHKDAPTEFRSRRVLGLHKRVHTYPCKQPPFAYYSSAVRFWQSLATSLSDGKVASSCTLTIVSAARAPSLRHRPGNWSDLGNRALRC